MCKRIHFNQENNFIDQRYEYSPSHVKYFISDYFNVAVVSVISEYEEEINDEIHDVVRTLDQQFQLVPSTID